MFDKRLDFGLLGESKISSWLRRRGRWVLPAYEKEENTGKGPRLWSPECRYITPDLLVFSADGIAWIEAKHKTVFSWHRITECWCTGIDRKHWGAYSELANDWSWEIWLLFLHESDQPDKRDIPFCPPKCPTGLFGGRLRDLASMINHMHDNWGPYGMVYWSHGSLRQFATLEEVNDAHIEISRSEIGGILPR